MIKRVLSVFLACILLTATAFATRDFAAGGDTAGGIIAFQLESGGFSDLQEWLDNSADAESYILTLKQYAPELDFTAFGEALEGRLAEKKTASAATRMKYALELIACGKGESPYIAEALAVDPGEQGVMPLVYALHLLNNGCSAAFTSEDIAALLLAKQLPDGGWAVVGERSDADVTAMTVQALAPLCEREEIAEAVGKAVDLLSGAQLPGGGFRSMGKDNCESTAQVILALAALGSDPFSDERFIKNGSLLDGLLEYRLDDGSFCHEPGGGYSAMATSQAFSALVCAYTRKPLHLIASEPQEVPEETREPSAQTQQIPQKTQEAPAQPQQNAPKNGFKPAALAITAGITALVCVILFAVKKRNPKNFIFAIALGAAAAAFILLTDFQSKDGYYTAEELSAEETAGHAVIAIYCHTIADEGGNVPADGVILPETRLPFREGATVYDLLISAAKKYGIRVENTGTPQLAYIASVQDVSEFDYGELSGWMYFVNGESPSVGCGEYAVSDGDLVEWKYTRNIGNDLAERETDQRSEITDNR